MTKLNNKRRTTIPKNTKAVLAVLKERAHTRNTITYGDLAEQIGLTYKAALAMRSPLNYIRDHVCLPHNRPWLWMLAVRKDTRRPGESATDGTGVTIYGQDGEQRWQKIKQETYDYDWSGVEIECE